MRFEDRLAKIRSFSASGDVEAAESLALDQLRESKGRTELNNDAVEMLKAFKNTRRFDSLCRVADRSMLVGADDPRIYPLYAQGLIDRGQLDPALTFLEKYDDRAFNPAVRSEIVGLMGRAYKQRFVEAERLGVDDTTDLNRAINCYREMYTSDPAWHGANLVALAHRAERDGAEHGLGLSAKELASQVLETVKPKLETTPVTDDAYPWLLASIAEVSIATGDWDTVTSHYKSFATSETVQPFHLASASRQLREIWGASPGTDDDPSRILTQLDIRSLSTPKGGGEVYYDAAERGQVLDYLQRNRDEHLAVEIGNLQAIHGQNGLMAVEVMETLLTKAPSVCRVINRHKYPNLRTGGSGFLVDGRELAAGTRYADDADWQGPVLLTNNHVLSVDGAYGSLRPDEAWVIVDKIDKTWHVDKLLWHSPPEELDVTVAKLNFNGQGDDVEMLKIDLSDKPLKRSEPFQSTEKIYVIGHPQGQRLSFGLADNRVVDHEFYDRGDPDLGYCRIHYPTPTQDGNSGGPVLDENQFLVIGVHRAIASGPLRTLPPDTEYRANEAVAMHSVHERLQ